MKLNDYLNKKEQVAILQAIRDAENQTSGEIKVHIENRCEKELLKRAESVFHLLLLHETEHKNGILIYIAFQDKKVAILGDTGIDALTPENYWENEVSTLIQQFKQQNFAAGIVQTIQAIGDKLQTFYPIQDNDVNEISDEISFYDN